MNRVDVKQMVQRAVGGEWEAFRQHHPALAEVVDQTLLVEQCMQNLSATPEFLEACRQVEVQGLAHGVLQELVVKLVRRWVRALV